MRHKNIPSGFFGALARITIVIFLIVGPASVLSFAQGDEMPPSNDNFSNAQVIGKGYGSVQGELAGATVEPGEPVIGKGGATVWYTWTAHANSSMTFRVRSETEPIVSIGIFIGEEFGKLLLLASGDARDRITMIVTEGQEYKIQASAKSPEMLDLFYLTWNVNGAESWKQFDFDGPDNSFSEPERGHSDFAIFRWWTVMSTGSPQWWIWSERLASSRTFSFGDVSVPMHYVAADYDGDEIADFAVFYPNTGLFWIFQSTTREFRVEQWGTSTDIPIKGDFDGDDIADVAIWRAETATFWIKRSSDDSVFAMKWGISSDKPILADYDGDGVTDLAVVRSNGEERKWFYIMRSSDQQVVIREFGIDEDTVVPGDFDADGKADIAVFRHGDSTFHYIRSSDQSYYAASLPAEFRPYADLVPGDYFGGPASDLCAWNYNPNGVFYCLPDGGMGEPLVTFQFGLVGDEPIASRGIH